MFGVTPLFGIGGIGGQEVVILGLVMLLLFGAKKLPELARSLGESLGEFRKGKTEAELEAKLAEAKLKEAQEAQKKADAS
jgi:sec-independent protein translocase protein TatA